LAAGVVVAAGFMIASGSIAAFEHVKSIDTVLVMSLALVTAFAGSVNGGVVLGLQRFGWVSGLTVLNVMLRVMLAAALVVLGFGATGAMLGVAVGYLIPYLLGFLPLVGLLRGPRSPIDSLRPLLSYSLVASLVSISNTLLLSLDTVLAKHYLLPQQSGLYAAMAVLGRTVLFVSTSVGTVMFPKVAALHARGERHAQVVLQALLGVLVLSMAVEAVLCVAPGLVIGRLFTPQYLPVAGQLAWYGFAMLLLAQAQVLTVYFLSVGHRFFVLFLLASCGVQFVLVAASHQTIEQIVRAVLVANGLLLVLLLATFALHVRSRPQPVESVA
jgi:O-antigen/teichoic acid export membrane protein